MNENEVKLYGVTLTYNESKMIPYVMPYYVRLGIDKLIVYDNQSTDNTVELLKQYPFVEVRTFTTNHTFNDKAHIDLKNKVYKEFIDDDVKWMMVTDFDEVIYYDGDNFKEYLMNKTLEGYNYYDKKMINVISEHFPAINDNLVHENVNFGNYWENLGMKTTLFYINDITTLRYTPGCHKCFFTTKKTKKNLKDDKHLMSFHLKYIDFDYNLEKFKIYSNRLSDLNRKKKWGLQYDRLKDIKKFQKEWNKIVGEGFNFLEKSHS